MFRKFGGFMPINNNNLNNTKKEKPNPTVPVLPHYMEEQQELYSDYISRHNRLVEEIKKNNK